MKCETYIDDIHCLIVSYFFATSFALSLCLILLNVSLVQTICTIIFMLLVLVICYFFTNRSYYFKKNEYLIKIGFITKRYKYKDIKKCFITYNNKVSYATSRKRICIKNKDKYIYISPENMDEVLMLLINRRA